jgi:hypothetical protein
MRRPGQNASTLPQHLPGYRSWRAPAHRAVIMIGAPLSSVEPSAVPAPPPVRPVPSAPPVPSARPSTVGTALAGLTALRDLPLAEHPDLYQSIHAELQGALADIDHA